MRFVRRLAKLGITTIGDSDGDGVGLFNVIYAELTNGQFASRAIDPSPDLLRELRGLISC